MDTNRSNSSIFIAFGAVVAVCCCSSVSHPHFERAWPARQPGIGLELFFCATYHANSWSNCARIANVCFTRLGLGKSYWLTVCNWSNGLIPY